MLISHIYPFDNPPKKSNTQVRKIFVSFFLTSAPPLHSALALIIRRRRGSVVDRHPAQIGGDLVELVQGRLGRVPLEEDVLLEPPGQGDGELVLHKGADGDGEDVVELLEGALHRLGDPEEDHDEGDDVEAGVQAKGADGVELLEQEGERGAEHGGPEQARGDGEAHARLAVGQGVHLGAVGEWDGTFTGRVEG